MTIDKTVSILVIDDELHICRNCLKILARPHYEVEYTLNGLDALKLMESKPFDIVITDLSMERLGGMEVIARINASFSDTIVIVMTGYASVSSAVEVMKMGAFDYLPKPFTPYELRAVVVRVPLLDGVVLHHVNRGRDRSISDAHDTRCSLNSPCDQHGHRGRYH